MLETSSKLTRPSALVADHERSNFARGSRSPGTAARTLGTKPPRLSVPILIESRVGCSADQPLTTGVPLPPGALRIADRVRLLDGDSREVPVQATALARWPDGSVKWLLVDFVPNRLGRGMSSRRLRLNDEGTHRNPPLRVIESQNGVRIDTGAAEFQLERSSRQPLAGVRISGRDAIGPGGGRIVLTDANGQAARPLVDRVAIEARGPLRATARLSGSFGGRTGCRFMARLCFFAGTGLVRLRFTIHNPRRARHRGGLWDLGDPGSVLFRDLAIELPLTGAYAATQIGCITEPNKPPHTCADGPVALYQDSSGGQNWQSTNHANRDGRVPCAFRGYLLRAGGQNEVGQRASPLVCVRNEFATVAAAVPEFWQQFPKAIEADNDRLSVRLFPAQFGDLFELQGGEQKTHTIWLWFGRSNESPTDALDWVHDPARARVPADWVARTGVLPHFLSAAASTTSRARTAKPTPFEPLVAGAMNGPNSLLSRRETIDEFGWRNFGDLYADHEAAHYTGSPPVISHYNNQYDCVLGMLLQYLRSGDTRWFDLADPLARHVIDIDIYHTDQDRAAYNGGTFWPTDHYLDAARSTHRTYSQENTGSPVRPYGGGPSNEHLYTTGLLHYFYLTGDPAARDAVVGLAGWVMRMDDGHGNVLGLIDDRPTGLASRTRDDDYHGPGRGAGNSINALVDAWLVTGERRYCDAAESLIRRVVHPADDLVVRDLANVEARWSYTVFLSVLARYLDLKVEHGELDSMYAYAAASLVHYARWMLDHEVPYLDRAETLEYPNETWAAQELRKANVLRLAARHVDAPLAARMGARADQLADHAWSRLSNFTSNATTRVIAITLIEGTRDTFFRTCDVSRMPSASGQFDFGRPQSFVPQRQRVWDLLMSPRSIAASFARLVWRAAAQHLPVGWASCPSVSSDGQRAHPAPGTLLPTGRASTRSWRNDGSDAA